MIGIEEMFNIEEIHAYYILSYFADGYDNEQSRGDSSGFKVN